MGPVALERRFRSQSAFTLIELLVVIAIIALLAAVLLPALTRAKTQAESARCKSNLHQMDVALLLYATDYNNRYPYSGYWIVGSNGYFSWEQALGGYYPVDWTNRAYHCPGYKGPISDSWLGDPLFYVGSYGYNWYGTAAWNWPFKPAEYRLGLGPAYYVQAAYGATDFSMLPAIKDSEVKSPSDMLTLADSRLYRPDGMPGGTIVGEDMLVSGRLSPVVYLWPYAARHGKNYNVACCDGHVEAIDPNLLYNPTNSALRWNNDHEQHPETWPP